MGFSRQEYWSGLPFPSLGDLPGPGIEPLAPALQEDSLLLNHGGSQLAKFKTGPQRATLFLSKLTTSQKTKVKSIYRKTKISNMST